jgi:cellulose synthase operon protein C
LERLRPRDPWVSRQLGFLKLEQKDRAAAHNYFAAALQISPADVYAAQNLFKLQIESADLKGAAETVHIMRTHQPGAATQAAEIILLLRKKQITAANAVLKKICASADLDAEPMEAAADAYHRAGRTDSAVKMFKHAIKSGSCHPQTAAAAIRLLMAQHKPLRAVWLFFSLNPGDLQRRAAAPLVRGLAGAKAKFAFRWLFWQRSQALADDDAAWGQVGYALSNFKYSKQAALWLSDWRSRRDVQPWMLFNLCLELRQLGRYAEATEVARHTIQKWEHRDGSASVRLFLAVEDVLAGNVPAAEEQLKLVTAREKVAYDQDLLAIVNALVQFQQAPEAERIQQFKAARAQLAKRFTARRMLHVAADVHRTFRRAGILFCEHGGGWRAKLWFGWKLNWQWLLPPLGLALWLGAALKRTQR